MDAGTATSVGKPKQAGMGNVPSPVEIFDVSICHKNLMSLDQPPEGQAEQI
jgi:hypothetical protein